VENFWKKMWKKIGVEKVWKNVSGKKRDKFLWKNITYLVVNPILRIYSNKKLF
jgi:hypothetical protein